MGPDLGKTVLFIADVLGVVFEPPKRSWGDSQSQWPGAFFKTKPGPSVTGLIVPSPSPERARADHDHQRLAEAGKCPAGSLPGGVPPGRPRVVTDLQVTTALLCTQCWTDYRLAWNSSRYEGVNILRIPAKRVWLPDIVLYNK